MTTGRDDDAFTWDGDDDPTLDTGTSSEPENGVASGEARPAGDVAPATAETTAVLPDGYTAVGRGSERVTRADAASEAGATAAEPAGTGSADGTRTAAERTPMGSVELIALGVLGGVYALFVIGWLIGGLRLQGWRPFLVTDAMYQASLWLAVLAPVLWFGTVFLLTRASPTWVRFAWLAAGVVLLVPWPFVMIGAMGQ